MANYVKATNFTAKDSLPSGNSGKIVKGAELDTEYTAIASAISSKSDINSPTFTGTPAAPTATTGSNTTQLATTAFVTGAATDLLSSTATFTNKTVNLSNNTVTGTTAQFNAALSDNDFATVAGAETLTNKTLTSPTINTATLASPTMTGTPVAPTATTGTNSTQLATTAFVTQEITALNLGNMSTQAKNSVDITGGTITGTYGLNTTGNAATATYATTAGNGGVTSVNGSTGAVTVPTTVKAWVKFVGSNGSISAALNVSSVTRSSAGIYTVNYTTAFANANYCVTTTSWFTGITTNSAGKSLILTGQSTTTTDVVYAGSVGGQDVTYGYVACFA